MNVMTRDELVEMLRNVDAFASGFEDDHEDGNAEVVGAWLPKLRALIEGDMTIEPVRIVVTLEGGMVQDVSCNVAADYVIVDYDGDGCDDAELCEVAQLARDDVTVESMGDAIVHSGSTSARPEFVSTRFAECEAHEAGEKS